MNKEKKRIGFVIFSMSSGGAERVVALLCASLVKYFDVFLYLVSIKGDIAYPLSEKVHIRYLSEDKKINALRKIHILKKYCFSDGVAVLIAFLTPCTFYASVVGKALKIPVVSSERNDPKRDPKGFLLRNLRFLSYLMSSKIVFQTTDALRFFPNIIRKKGVVIPNPINPSLSGIKRTFDSLEDSVIFVGRPQKQKNLNLLLDSFEKFHSTHPSFTLQIIGTLDGGDFKDRIAASTCRSSIQLLGHIGDVSTYLAKAKVFVLTSDYEGMPNSLMEAMAVGVPCISTDCPCGGARVLMENDKGGILVEVGDSDAFAMALVKVAENYSHFYQEALQYKNFLYSHFSIDSVVAAWMETLTKVLGIKREEL